MREPDEPAPEAIAALYDRLAQLLYRYALMILASPADAEDVVQRVFAALMSPHECYSLLRRPIRRKEEAVEGHLLEAVEAVADDPDERLGLERALLTLPPEQREVVELKAFEGLTFDAIARVTDESINTVAGRYRYALVTLRRQLGGLAARRRQDS